MAKEKTLGLKRIISCLKIGEGFIKCESKITAKFWFSLLDISINTFNKSMAPTFFTGTVFLSSKRCLAGIEVFVVASLYSCEVFFSLRLVSSF